MLPIHLITDFQCLRPTLWSRGNIIISHAAGPVRSPVGSISWLRLAVKQMSGNLGQIRPRLSTWPSYIIRLLMAPVSDYNFSTWLSLNNQQQEQQMRIEGMNRVLWRHKLVSRRDSLTFGSRLHCKHREISIALDSKREYWTVRWRRLTRGDTEPEMCADSTVCKYILRIHGGSQIVVAHRYSHSRAHSPAFPSLHLRHNSFSNPSVALPTSQLIFQPLRCFTYVTVHSPTLLSLLLCHKLFS